MIYAEKWENGGTGFCQFKNNPKLKLLLSETGGGKCIGIWRRTLAQPGNNADWWKFCIKMDEYQHERFFRFYSVWARICESILRIFLLQVTRETRLRGSPKKHEWVDSTRSVILKTTKSNPTGTRPMAKTTVQIEITTN